MLLVLFVMGFGCPMLTERPKTVMLFLHVHTHTQLLTATRMGTKIYAWLNLSVTLDVF